MTIDDLLKIKPDEVYKSIPSRLVVGMTSCQMNRLQVWLENFLNPLAMHFGSFEYLKDSNDYLFHIETIKETSASENWDWSNVILFTVDVKALYPSICYDFLAEAIQYVFDTCTTWTPEVKALLIELIMYTLENQQLFWNDMFYILNKGIPTGSKHAVPLANMFMSFILIDALKTDEALKEMFDSKIKLWKRFIDDGTGIFAGSISDFLEFYTLLQVAFGKYNLELTCDTDSYSVTTDGLVEKATKQITFLDVELFMYNGTLHTREHRKETSANSYLLAKSAHPRHTYPGIIKSQLCRIHRLCSLEKDYLASVKNLRIRCMNSGYKITMIDDILSSAGSLSRTLEKPLITTNVDSVEEINLIVLAGTPYESEFCALAARLNPLLISSDMKVKIIKSTSLSLSRLLFNNNNTVVSAHRCPIDKKCVVCTSNIRSNTGVLTSNVTKEQYFVDSTLNCDDGGIYVVDGACGSQYTGKTVDFQKRFKKHFTSKTSSVYSHKKHCNDCAQVSDFEVTYVENYLKRGKYSLSEREYLWNHRIKGTINIQKTLKST